MRISKEPPVQEANHKVMYTSLRIYKGLLNSYSLFFVNLAFFLKDANLL